MLLEHRSAHKNCCAGVPRIINRKNGSTHRFIGSRRSPSGQRRAWYVSVVSTVQRAMFALQVSYNGMTLTRFLNSFYSMQAKAILTFACILSR